jgi:DNA-binding PadR family transcriptional regulator
MAITLNKRQIAILDMLAAADELTAADMSKKFMQAQKYFTGWAGSLYPNLVKLEHNKLISARWKENVPYPRPRLYRITDDGRRRQRMTKLSLTWRNLFGTWSPSPAGAN